MSEDFLIRAINAALLKLEANGDIVLCSALSDVPAKQIHDAVIELVPNDQISLSEMSALRALVLQAIDDNRFFDWEMPTLTGLTAEEFRALASKLPKA